MRYYNKWGRLSLIALVIFLPYVLHDPYYLHIAIKALIVCIAVLGLGVLVGFTGQLSLAHATFMGIGAYTSSLMSLKASWPFWACFLSAGLLSGIIGALVGYPFLRLRGHYFAISTLALCILGEQIFSNWRFLTHGPPGITMGPGHVVNIPPPQIVVPFYGPFLVESKTSYYYLVAAVLLLTLYVMHRLLASKTGRALIAMREEEDLARAVGIDPTKYKVFAFFLSSVIAGLAGSLYAHYVRFLCAGTFNFLESFYLLIAVIIGGKDSIPGLIAGAIFITMLPEIVAFPAAAPMVTAVSITVLAAVLVLTIIFLPKGLVQLISVVQRRKV